MDENRSIWDEVNLQKYQASFIFFTVIVEIVFCRFYFKTMQKLLSFFQILKKRKHF